jgi:hypothetical protein
VKDYEPRPELFRVLSALMAGRDDLAQTLIARLTDASTMAADQPCRPTRAIAGCAIAALSAGRATLRQLFAIPEFRSRVVSADPTDNACFVELQVLFSELLFFRRSRLTRRPLSRVGLTGRRTPPSSCRCSSSGWNRRFRTAQTSSRARSSTNSPTFQDFTTFPVNVKDRCLGNSLAVAHLRLSAGADFAPEAV